MTKILRLINDISVVDSIQSVITNGNIKHYKVEITLSDLRLVEHLEKLWNFGTVKLSKNFVSAEYIVCPNEVHLFYNRILKFDSLINKKPYAVVRAGR